MNEFIREGSEMKTGRILVLLALVMGLLAGPWQAPAEAVMLGRVGQIKYLDYTDGNWYQILPDGTTSTFTLAPGAIFCHDRYSGPVLCHRPRHRYRPLSLLPRGCPTQAIMYIANLTDFKYPGSDTVWGGRFLNRTWNQASSSPFSPILKVRQLPQPPA